MIMSSEYMLGLKLELSQKDWSDLPPELLEQIYKRLVMSDQARFASICKPWLSIASANPPPSPPVPESWLVFRNPDDGGQVPENKNVSQTKGFTGEKPLVLVNPILNAEIMLPPINSSKNIGDIKKLLVVVETFGDISVVTSAIILATNFIISIKLDNRRWEYHYISSSDDIVFYKGKIYALEIHLYTVLTVISWPRRDKQMELLPMQFQVVQGIFHPSSSEKNRKEAYLLESRGDLLIVTRQSKDLLQTGGFEVFKLVEGNGCVDAVKLQSLGDQALFWGRDGCISLPIGEFSQFEENHIYFIDVLKEKPLTEEENFVYSIEDGEHQTNLRSKPA